MDVIGRPEPQDGVFVDVFAGTGVVSREAAVRGWRVCANDHLLSSAAITTAQLVSEEDVPFRNFGGYWAALIELGKSDFYEGFIFHEYSPSGQSRSGHKRLYFTCENAARIDGLRRRVSEWVDSSTITPHEEKLLIADLLFAANAVANIAGTYGCFLRTWGTTAVRSLQLTPRPLMPRKHDFEVLTLDAFHVPTCPEDVAYLDPPYTKRQYAAYYHVLETITAGDNPVVEGITGLRPWESKSSLFCYKRHALKAIARLIDCVDARRVFLSYSSEGHVSLDELKGVLSDLGAVRAYPMGNIGRYRPNQVARDNGENVEEYLVSLAKVETASLVVAK